MLYGFGNRGNIVVVAGDTLQEFERASEIFCNAKVKFTIPSIMDTMIDIDLRGLEMPPIILTAGNVATDILMVEPRTDAISRHGQMMKDFGEMDSTSQLFNMFEAQNEPTRETASAVWDLSYDDLFPTSDRDLIFTTYSDAESGTIAIVTSRGALLQYQMPLHAHFKQGARIQNLIDLPNRFLGEIATGCFTFDGSPLAARKALLEHGLREDVVLSRMIQRAFTGRPDASTIDETVYALELIQPFTGNDFIFAAAAHPNKPSTFVAITPRSQWSVYKSLPVNIYLTPVISKLLPDGFGESQPGIFEVLQDIGVVREQLTRVGMNEHNGIREPLTDLLNGIVIAPIAVPISNSAIDWDALVANWPTMDTKARMATLPNNQISFAILETSTSSCFVFLTPCVYFKETGNFLTHDLSLENRIMSVAEKAGANIFKIIGPDPIQVRAMLTQDGFIDDYGLTLHMNMALYSGELGVDIGVDPLA